jgi:hypothetical protein
MELMRKYNECIIEIINSLVQKNRKSLSGESTLEQIQRLLKLSKPDDWGRVCTAYETINDTSYAIENFVKFRLGGPTKYEDYGERVLRLYGFLNATYIQQNVICTLSNIFNAHHSNFLKQSFDSLKITDLRHKLASHNAAYLDNKTKRKDAYITGELESSGENLLYGSNINNETETVNLIELLDEHSKTVIKALDAIFEKLIDLLYKTSEDKQNEFRKDLKLLRIEKEGGTVTKISPQSSEEIIVIHPIK